VGGGEKYRGERERERSGRNMVFKYCMPIIIETYASPEVPATVF
jgi:hypothetical protein